MSESIEIKQRILTRASEMFNEFGLSKVTMEEIAAGLGMSKKTLYKHFSNKEHLLRELIHDKKCLISGKIGCIVDNTELPFIEKLKQLLGFMAKISNDFNQRLTQDIMRFHPELWNEIKEFRKKDAWMRIATFIREGAEQGIIRNDINQDLITLIYIGAIHSAIGPENVDTINLSMDRIYSDTLKVIYEGILSDKGREEFLSAKILSTNKENI
ncbi:MAG: TetR/AcrR family transcriptional regulator [Ignavibacteriales bacterium]|nr:TetR/AcrR family transcriptional regulator [Ignavibacteriales bacterium]